MNVDVSADLFLFAFQGQEAKWVSSTHLAQLLSRIERKLAKHVGAEEFVQCHSSVLLKTAPMGAPGNSNSTSTSITGCLAIPASAPIGVQGPKKTCNLEQYLEWSLKLKMLVANNILQVSGRWIFVCETNAVTINIADAGFNGACQDGGAVERSGPVLSAGGQLQQRHSHFRGPRLTGHSQINSHCGF